MATLIRYLFLIVLFLPGVVYAADDHTHFDTEKVKSGVQFYRAYRTTLQIEDDNWCFCDLNAGDDGMAYYDETIDGAVLPIKRVNGSNVPFSVLTPGNQSSFSSTDEIWIQFEQYLDQDFYNASTGSSGTLGFDTMKMWRYHMAKGQCGTEDRFITLTWLGTDDDAVEVAVSSSCYGWPDQGLDTNYTIPADQWYRMTTVFDVADQEIRFYATSLATGITTEFYSYPTFFPSTFTVEDMRLQLHSTTRNHNPGDGADNYDFIMGFRNVIVSKSPIAFTTSGGGDELSPVVSIDQTSPQSITSDSLSITGTATDAVGVTDVEWQIGSAPSGSGTNCTADDGSFGGTSEDFTCSTSGYSNGSNAIHVGASDAAGNWGTDSIVVNYTPPGTATDYYIDADADAGCDGLSSATSTDGSGHCAFNEISDINAVSLPVGSTVYLQAGDSWSEDLDCNYTGESGNRITYTRYGAGDNPVVEEIDITADYITIDGIDVDHNKAATTAIAAEYVGYITFANMEIKNGTRDGIALTSAHDVLIDNCNIHHFLNGYYGRDPVLDAHGIGIVDSYGITIQDSTIHTVSGDCIQADPDRGEVTDNITITDTILYTAPLAEDFNGTCPSGDGWCAGDSPGENGIDTKSDIASVATWTLTNITAYGWTNIAVEPANRAAFNIKENVDMTMDRIKVYDSEIAFRLRGDTGNGNPDVTIMNAIIYDCDKAYRVEDDITDLKIYNNTVGAGVTTYVDEGGMTEYVDWDLRNNAFLGTKDALFSDSSNISVDAGDFTDTGTDDYTVASGSDLIAAGDDIAAVTVDYTGETRSGTMDVGAYAYSDQGQPGGGNGFTGVSSPAGGVLFNAN